MAMRETVTSMRVYFGLVAAVTALFALGGFRGAHGNAIVIGLAALEAVFVLGFLYLTIALRSILLGSAAQVFVLLWVCAGLNCVIGLWSLSPGLNVWLVGRAVVSVLIAWYLTMNARRLSRELKAQTPPPLDVSRDQ